MNGRERLLAALAPPGTPTPGAVVCHGSLGSPVTPATPVERVRLYYRLAGA